MDKTERPSGSASQILANSQDEIESINSDDEYYHPDDGRQSQLIPENSEGNHQRPITLTQENHPKTRTSISNPQQQIEKSDTNLSKSSSYKFDTSKIVPKNKRRGILAFLSIIPEYDNPRELPKNVKYMIVFVIAVCAIIGPMGTSILLPASESLIDDLDTTVTIVNISIGIYLISLGVFPLWWSNFSERHGRRSIYIISFTLYFCFSIGCALAKSIGMLIGFRVLAGGCAASVQAVGAGTISDLYAVQERGSAMGIYYLGTLAAPLLAPIVGGAISTKKSWGWRGTQWFLVIMAGCCVIMILFGLPETLRAQDNREAVRLILRERLKKNNPADEESSLHDDNTTDEDDEQQGAAERETEEIDRILDQLTKQPTQIEDEEYPVDALTPIGRISSRVSQKQRDNELRKLYSQVDEIANSKHRSINQQILHYLYIYGFSPLKSLNFFRYPPVLLAILYSAPCYAVLYYVNMTLTYCYSRPPYNFGPMLVGLVYIPNSVTYLIASVWGGKFNDYLLEQKRKKYGIVAPEARFGINIYAAAAILPGSLLIIGWCLDKHEHWVTPLVGTAFFGFAQMLVIGVTVTYVADSLPGRGATGIALSNFIRMLLASGTSFSAEPLIRAIGVGPLFSILAGFLAFLSVILVVIKKNGDRWRETYNLEKLYDIVDS